MENKRILVIEDNIAEAIYAQTELARAGITDFSVVGNLAEALDKISRYNGVLSDLFFPLGDLDKEPFVSRFLPVYTSFKEKRFKSKNPGPVLRAIEGCAESYGMTPHDYVENVMAKLNTPKSVLKDARDAVKGITDSERYEAFIQIQEGIKNGTNLPLGTIATEQASHYFVPSVIVTSTDHHSDAFEAVSSSIKVSYVDWLVDGRKDWKSGIERLIQV